MLGRELALGRLKHGFQKLQLLIGANKGNLIKRNSLSCPPGTMMVLLPRSMLATFTP
jgi:hypothetical protein